MFCCCACNTSHVRSRSSKKKLLLQNTTSEIQLWMNCSLRALYKLYKSTLNYIALQPICGNIVHNPFNTRCFSGRKTGRILCSFWEFKHNHYHTIGHTGCAFGRRKFAITAAEVSLAVKTLKATGYDEMLKALKLRWVSLVDPCVSSGLVLWEDTKILANWGDLTNIQDGRWKRMHQLLRHSLLSLPVRAYTNCLGKDTKR